MNRLEPKMNPIGTVCFFQTVHKTLPDLQSYRSIRTDIKTAKEYERLMPGFLRKCAETYKQEFFYDEWEKNNR